MYGDEQLKGPGMSLTLLHTEDFSKKKAVMAKARSCSEVLKSGCTYSCSESYGGNSLTLCYPYLHLTTDEFVVKQRLKDALKFQNELPGNIKAKIDQGAYVELDQCSDDREKFEVTDHNHVIFIGIRTHPMAKDKLARNWRDWSKINLLYTNLLSGGIEILGVNFLKQTAPPKTQLFTYCFLVAINLESKNEKLTTLNVLHKLRGSIMPGYVSLFEKHQSPPPGSRKSLSDSLDLENLLEGDVDSSDAESMGESDLESVLNAKINGTA